MTIPKWKLNQKSEIEDRYLWNAVSFKKVRSHPKKMFKPETGL